MGSYRCSPLTFLRIVLSATILVHGAFAADTNPAFEVATVKTSDTEGRTRRFSIQGQAVPDS